MRILIAVPTYENIYPDTFESIYGLDPGDHELLFKFVRGYDVATARNRIAQTAIDNEVDFVLMVDNDVVLPEDALLNLLEHDEDVCLGYYAHRDADNIYRGRVNICKLGPFNYPLESEYTAEEVKGLRDDGTYIIQIHGGGMGCALIRTEVFNSIPYPWYKWVVYEDDNRGMLSEDLFFCERCRHANIPIYSDTRVGCGHLLRRIQWPE